MAMATTIMTIVATVVCLGVSGKTCAMYEKKLPVAYYGQQVIYSQQKHAVYMFGGTNGTRICCTNGTIYKWDLTVTNSWFEQIIPTPTNVFYSLSNNAVLINNTVFFIGVRDTLSSAWTTQTVRTFNTITETWSTAGSIPGPPRSDGCIATNNTHIFMADGYYDLHDTHGDAMISIYNVATQNWSSISLNFTTQRGWWAQDCAVMGNAFYVWGGFTQYPQSSSLAYKLDTVTSQASRLDIVGFDPPTFERSVMYKKVCYGVAERVITGYDFVDDASNPAAFAMSTANATRSAGVVLMDDRMYIFGGQSDDNHVLDVVQICDLSADSDDLSPDNYWIPPVVALSLVWGGLCVIFCIYCKRVTSRYRSRKQSEEVRVPFVSADDADHEPSMSTSSTLPTREQQQQQVVADDHGQAVGSMSSKTGGDRDTKVDLLVHTNQIADHDAEQKDDEVSADDAQHEDIDEEKEAPGQEVREWLNNTVHLPQYFPLFMEHEINDLQDIRDLEKDDLDRMGIHKVGQQVRIIRYAQRINAAEGDQEEDSLDDEGTRYL